MLSASSASTASRKTVLGATDSGNGISCAEYLLGALDADLLLRFDTDNDECGIVYAEPGLLSGKAILCAVIRDDEVL